MYVRKKGHPSKNAPNGCRPVAMAKSMREADDESKGWWYADYFDIGVLRRQHQWTILRTP